MTNLFVYISCVVAGSLAGLGLGIIVPISIAALDQGYRARFSTDHSSSGFGFFIIFTIPAGLIAGGIFGFGFARELLNSGEGVRYLTHGSGLATALIAAVGILAALIIGFRLIVTW